MDGFDPPSSRTDRERYDVEIARNDCVKEPIDIMG